MKYLYEHALKDLEPEEGDYEHQNEMRQTNCLINPLFWVSCFGSPDLLKEMLDRNKVYYDNRIYRGEDSEKYDPFMKAVECEDDEVLDVWAEYFKKHRERLLVHNEEFLNKLIKSKDSKIQELGIEMLISNPSCSPNVKPIRKFSLTEQAYEYVTDSHWQMSSRIKKNLKDKQKKEKAASDVETKSTPIALPTNLAYNYDLIDSFGKMTSDNIRKARPLILSLYSENWWCFFLYSLIALIEWILFFFIVISREKERFVVVLFFGIFIFLVLFELADLASKGVWEYITSNFNFFDAIIYISGVALVYYVTNQDHEFLNSQFPNFFSAALLHLALTRIVSLFRIFRPFRYLILMILKVYRDIFPFLILLAIYIAGTGWILMLVDVTNSLLDFSLGKFWKNWDTIYNWGYGNWEIDIDEINGVSWGFYLYNGVFMLILFNLLIAIISGTYDEYTDNRELVDAQDVLNMLSSMASFSKCWSNFIGIFTHTKGTKKKYFYFVVPRNSDIELNNVYELQKSDSENLKKFEDKTDKKFKNLSQQFHNLQEKIKENEEKYSTVNEERYNLLMSKLNEISQNVDPKNKKGFLSGVFR